MKKYSVYLLLLVALILSACGSKGDEVPEVLLTPPAISVNVTRENCPSMELEAGMWVAWTNVDTVSLPIKIEFSDENGKGAGTGLSVIEPGTTFSTNFPESGIFNVYCTDNTDTHATITVK